MAVTDAAPTVTAGTDDLELVEMVNLPTKYTGLDGVVYVSTAQGAHGPRVKWYPGRPGRDLPCLSVTVGDAPQATNHRLPPRVAAAAAEPLTAWVALNRSSLLSFWQQGHEWTIDEVNEFIAGLRRL